MLLFWIVPMSFFFFFNDTATTEIYPLSLHDALPIFAARSVGVPHVRPDRDARRERGIRKSLGKFCRPDRKSTRLNSSHSQISYAVFCLKKKKNEQAQPQLVLLNLPLSHPCGPRPPLH